MSKDSSSDIIISVDAGASEIRSVLFDYNGKTIGFKVEKKGANLVVNGRDGILRIISLMKELLSDNGLSFDCVDLVSIGVAGLRDDETRLDFFKKLDEMNIGSKSHLSSDVAPIFEINCPDPGSVLVNVGTGAILVGRSIDGSMVKVAGEGHDKDLGSGYWMGKEVFLKLSGLEREKFSRADIEEVLELVENHFGESDLSILLDSIMKSDDSVREIASISKFLIELAELKNELALSIVQESTSHVSNYLLSLLDMIEYDSFDLVAISNGSVINNKFYLSSLNDALSFDLGNIKWLSPSISTAYYPGLLSSRIKGSEVLITDIVSGEYVV